jgi:ubiquinone/menaquinone biosynthesis C-methylase UbiE
MRRDVMNGKKRSVHDHGGIERQKQGVSSFALHDSELAFREMKLKEGDSFLDIGCGPGDYAVRASAIVGDSGTVYALDRWKELIDKLKEKADSQGLRNIRAMVSDITCSLPVKDSSIDVCFIATVLHGFDFARDGEALFSEIRRVLKPGGRVAVVEFKKEEMDFGPPVDIRLSPKDVEDLLTPYGFQKRSVTDLGCSYMIQLSLR